MENTFKAWFLSFVHLFFPRQCAVCGSSLQEGEEGICIRCNMNMPRTNYHLREDNSVERMFWGKIPLEHATSCFFYHKGSDFRRILHQLKYFLPYVVKWQKHRKGAECVTDYPTSLLPDRGRCTGCGACAGACPNAVISIIPEHKRKPVVLCQNKDKGAQTRKACSAGCIGCMKCAKACPKQAITVENNLAYIDQEKCVGCGLCELYCPDLAVECVREGDEAGEGA